MRQKEGTVERVQNAAQGTFIVKGLVQKDGDLHVFDGMKVEVIPSSSSSSSSPTLVGVIEGPFGKSGKLIVRITPPPPADTVTPGAQVSLSYRKTRSSKEQKSLLFQWMPEFLHSSIDILHLHVILSIMHVDRLMISFHA